MAELLKKETKKLKEDAKAHEAYINFESLGDDSSKLKKNKEKCSRGHHSAVSRYCSARLRNVYQQGVLGTDMEFCVNGFQEQFCDKVAEGTQPLVHECRLCYAEKKSNIMELGFINLAEALGSALNDSQSKQNLHQRLCSYLYTLITSDYPKPEHHSKLKVTINGKVHWVYLKLTTHTAMIKTASPSSYKYQDRVSIGRHAKVQFVGSEEIILYFTKNPNYVNESYETKRPVTTGVGFWNLSCQRGEDLRQIVHFSMEQVCNIDVVILASRDHTIQNVRLDLVTKSPLPNSSGSYLLYEWSGSPRQGSLALSEGDSPAYFPSYAISPMPLPQLDLPLLGDDDFGSFDSLEANIQSPVIEQDITRPIPPPFTYGPSRSSLVQNDYTARGRYDPCAKI